MLSFVGRVACAMGFHRVITVRTTTQKYSERVRLRGVCYRQCGFTFDHTFQ